MRFDVVTSFDVDAAESVRILTDELKEMYPDYNIFIIHDIDVSD